MLSGSSCDSSMGAGPSLLRAFLCSGTLKAAPGAGAARHRAQSQRLAVLPVDTVGT